MKRLRICSVKTYCHWIFLFILFVGLFSHIDGFPIAGAYPNGDTDVISYLDADDYIGETKTVEGTIVNTFKYTKGNVIFLNFHDPYEGYFTAIIWSSDWSKFPMSPDIYYKYEKVRVTGEIIEYKGSSEIVVSHPSQIEIMTNGYTSESSYNREYNDYYENQRYDDYVERRRYNDYFETFFFRSLVVGGFFILWILLSSVKKDEK